MFNYNSNNNTVMSISNHPGNIVNYPNYRPFMVAKQHTDMAHGYIMCGPRCAAPRKSVQLSAVKRLFASE